MRVLIISILVIISHQSICQDVDFEKEKNSISSLVKQIEDYVKQQDSTKRPAVEKAFRGYLTHEKVLREKLYRLEIKQSEKEVIRILNRHESSKTELIQNLLDWKYSNETSDKSFKILLLLDQLNQSVREVFLSFSKPSDYESILSIIESEAALEVIIQSKTDLFEKLEKIE